MKVTEFLEQERARLATAEERVRAEAADAYTATVGTFPFRCRREFLDWLGDGGDIPHDSFPSILRRVAGHNEVHDRLGVSPAYAQELLDRWQASHAHE
ncbi:MAG TPA: hypothetical protein VHS99_13650 [Chloroflexota bacterium]|jgi:hypothetical protein|nr:hypothetical protein [Chloroflexota bacterium]